MNRTHTIVLPDREIKLSLPVSGPVGCTPDPKCCPDPVKLPVIPLGFPGESPGPLGYFLLAIGGSGLHDKIDVGWSVSPSDPNRVALTWYDFSPLAVGLCVARPDSGADLFRVTVTAALSWVCADVPHATTFVWELDYPPVS